MWVSVSVLEENSTVSLIIHSQFISFYSQSGKTVVGTAMAVAPYLGWVMFSGDGAHESERGSY